MDYEKLTVAELKDLLREGGLPLSGKKAELIQRASENHAYLEILADNKKRASGAINRTVIFLASVSLLLSYAIAIDEIIVLGEISDSFYSDVISESIRIFVFLGFVSVIQYFIIPFQVDNASVTYGVRLFEVYPQTIGSYDYTYGSDNEQVIVPITLNFRTWANLTIDQINGATVGKKVGDVPTIKANKDFGLFGGILNKLPPELRRAGRDVLQATRRNLPIGRITGGRAFPPFG